MFAAVRPPADQVVELADFLEAGGITSSGIRVINDAKWHITLAFMPQVQFPRADALHDGLAALCSRTPPLELVLRGAGLFPRPGNSSPIWMGVEGDLSELEQLAAGCRTAGYRAGIRVDSPKHFRPHLTVSRRPPPDHAGLWLERLNQFRGTPWTVSDIVVMESTLSRGTPARYSIVQRHALTG